jgi:hypothetical protein
MDEQVIFCFGMDNKTTQNNWVKSKTIGSMGKNIKQSVKWIAFNTVHKKDTVLVFGHGPTRTNTDVIFSPLWIFTKEKSRDYWVLSAVVCFVCGKKAIYLLHLVLKYINLN